MSKGFFSFGSLVGTEKIGMQSSGPSGYSVAYHLLYFMLIFYRMRSSGPWLVQCRLPFVFYFINSRVVIFFWRYDNLKYNFLIFFVLLYCYYSMRWIIKFRIPSTYF
jgi:hypothetical protein